MSPNELEIMGMVLPIGTYVFYDDGVSDSGLYGYCTDGTITIAEADAGKYKIDYDLETVTGYKVTGSYEGSVTLTDSSDDKEDDGSSTLTEDLELDLSYLTAANEPARASRRRRSTSVAWVTVTSTTLPPSFRPLRSPAVTSSLSSVWPRVPMFRIRPTTIPANSSRVTSSVSTCS